MIAIEDERTLIITRGDDTNELNHIAFYLPVYNDATGEEEKYNFKPEDKITFIVSEKKGYTKTKVLVVEHTLREMGYVHETQYPELILTAEDSNAFDVLDKKKTYWYELVLNDTHTIIGHHHEDNAAKLIVLPSAKDNE
jgi:hypothetical protein